MPPLLTAADAIGPALTRTRQMLFAPFRAGRSWKLAVTCYLARSATIFFPFPILYLAFLPQVLHGNSLVGAPLLIGIAIFGTAVILVLLYLCTRLQFVMVELILERGVYVAPAWRRYGRPATALTLAKAVAGTILTGILAVPLVAFGRNILTFAISVKPGQPPPPEFMESLFLAYALFFLVIGSYYFVSVLLHDLVLPPMTLRGADVLTSLREGWSVVRGEPGSFALFALLKFVLMFVGYLMAVLAFEVVLLACIALLLLAGLLLHLAGIASTVLIALGIPLGIVIYLAVVGYVAPLCVGSVAIFIEAHALYFLAGRLPGIAESLAQSGEVSAAAPPFPYPGTIAPPPYLT